MTLKVRHPSALRGLDASVAKGFTSGGRVRPGKEMLAPSRVDAYPGQSFNRSFGWISLLLRDKGRSPIEASRGSDDRGRRQWVTG